MHDKSGKQSPLVGCLFIAPRSPPFHFLFFSGARATGSPELMAVQSRAQLKTKGRGMLGASQAINRQLLAEFGNAHRTHELFLRSLGMGLGLLDAIDMALLWSLTVPKNDSLVPRHWWSVSQYNSRVPRNGNSIPENERTVPFNQRPTPINDGFVGVMREI